MNSRWIGPPDRPTATLFTQQINLPTLHKFKTIQFDTNLKANYL